MSVSHFGGRHCYQFLRTINWGTVCPLIPEECYIFRNKGAKVHFYIRGFNYWGTKGPLILFLCDIFPVETGQFD